MDIGDDHAKHDGSYGEARRYLGELARHYYLFWGSASVSIVGVCQNLTKQMEWAWIWYLIALLGILRAAFLVWRDKHREALKLQREQDSMKEAPLKTGPYEELEAKLREGRLLSTAMQSVRVPDGTGDKWINETLVILREHTEDERVIRFRDALAGPNTEAMLKILKMGNDGQEGMRVLASLKALDGIVTSWRNGLK